MAEIVSALFYWALVGIAFVGGITCIISVCSGRWSWLMVGCAAMVPYVGVWVLNYGSNCLIRKEIPVTAEIVNINADVKIDGHTVFVRLTPQQHTFFAEPTAFEFTNYGVVDNRHISVVKTTAKRGVDGLIRFLDLQLFVPNIGSSGIRLTAIEFGKRRYTTKSSVLSFVGTM